MKKKIVPQAPKWAEQFEKLYIYTYQEVYDHAKLLVKTEDMARKLLVLTYSEAYAREKEYAKQSNLEEWLKGLSDMMAICKLNVSEETAAASYAKEKIQEKDGLDKSKIPLDETSVYLEIMDKIHGDEEKDGDEPASMFALVRQIILCVIFVAAAVMIYRFGSVKLKNQIYVLKEPFMETIPELKSEEELEAEKGKQDYVVVGGKVVYLSDIGQVLYSVPIEEAGLFYEPLENTEIQQMTGWTYYLPCPEKSNSQLPNVDPSLYHTLYRMRGDGKEIEIIEREVDEYTFWEDGIYIYKYGRVQRIDADGQFEKGKAGVYLKIEDGEFYLYDSFGRTLETDSDGSIHYGDRVFVMSSNQILDVKPQEHKWEQETYVLKKMDDKEEQGVYVKKNGKEKLFLTANGNIDSFCVVKNWIYCSISRKNGDSYESRICRKYLADESDPENVGKEFKGRMDQLYYSEDKQQIYANYKPDAGESNYGVIAAISLDGQISILNDEEQRDDRETTGNDALEFLLVQNGQVYCYWKDYRWEPGENPVMLWKRAMVLSDEDRIFPEHD